MKTARIYMRVSTDQQDLERQRQLIDQARAEGYYIAGTYTDKASGTHTNRPGLQRMIDEIQPGDVVIAEKIDRITRAPLADAEALVRAIEDKGARLAVPGMLDLTEIEAEGMARIVLDTMQTMILRITLQMARDDYETRRARQAQGIARAKRNGVYKGRPKNLEKREKIAELLEAGFSVRRVAKLAGASTSTVQNVKNAMKSGEGED